jgi:hypothetical protein
MINVTLLIKVITIILMYACTSDMNSNTIQVIQSDTIFTYCGISMQYNQTKELIVHTNSRLISTHVNFG